MFWNLTSTIKTLKSFRKKLPWNADVDLGSAMYGERNLIRYLVKDNIFLLFIVDIIAGKYF